MSEDDQVVGKLATVVHPISPGQKGEVLLHIRGGTEVYMAVSDTALGRDEQVLVIGHPSARMVRVTPFPGAS